jgi:hypothetical protein
MEEVQSSRKKRLPLRKGLLISVLQILEKLKKECIALDNMISLEYETAHKTTKFLIIRHSINLNVAKLVHAPSRSSGWITQRP